jgi:hypothetical protein
LVHGLDEPSYAGRALANAPDTGVRDRGGGSATALAGHHRIGHTRTQRGAERHLRIFDGQLARSDLDGVYVMAQVSYIVVAGLAVAAAIGRIWAIQRGRVHNSVSDVRM